MTDPKLCQSVVDYSDEKEAEITCGDPADFECCGEYLCSEHAHEWLDELESGLVHEVSVLKKEPQ